MVAKLAKFSYAMLLPDVYYTFMATKPRSTRQQHSATLKERKRMISIYREHHIGYDGRDGSAFFDYLAARPEAAGKRCYAYDYCIGG
ncbi:dienelactone hydrolase family protein [Mycobacterium uberis]|uniref:dienelactone hydrolase family protein n=1 Tax=Mycobacterium uberis TaxID=2162698 RepID=UPI001FB487A8|nr:dienelactone hydrolase family protein [Mycobacterium uberis]